MKQSLTVLACIILLTGCAQQKPLKEKYSLLTWELQRGTEGVVPNFEKHVLIKYTWTDSGYTRKELFSTDYYYPHYSSFDSEIYNDRFVITDRGDVFDLTTNKMIQEHLSTARLLYRSGDSVFFKYYIDTTLGLPFDTDKNLNKASRTKYFYFDLSTQKINFLPGWKAERRETFDSRSYSFDEVFFVNEDALSPDRKKVAFFVSKKRWGRPEDYGSDSSVFMTCAWSRIFPNTGDVYMRTANGDSTLLVRDVVMDFHLWSQPALPIIWLNDNELMTQEKNGTLIRITLSPRRIIKFPPIKDVWPCSFSPRFEKLWNGQLIYHCPAKTKTSFLVNLENNSCEQLDSIPLSNVYSIKLYGPDAGYAQDYFYNGKPMLTDTTITTKNNITPENLFAVQCMEVIPSRNQYDHWNTVRIFDPTKNTWDSIVISNLNRMIGWVKND